ncbi:P-loop containing nucleoside triphosphate hydrolase protein, partial [Ochromonadaceae sp. CCMP2298]
MEEQSEPVRVYIRIRPEFEEKNAGTPQKNSRGQTTLGVTSNNCCTVIDAHSIKILPPDGTYGPKKNVAVDDKVFSFDKILPDNTSQEDVYRCVADNVHATVRGYNTTIFAYGTTGSGKSYTMTGNKAAPGIIPRAIGDLFKHIENAAAEEHDVFFYVRLSYVELYNNTFRNLLESVHQGPAPRHDKIEVRESQSAGVFLAGPNLRFPVTSALEAFQLISRGNKMRAVGATACNDFSSRSHAILTIHVESRILSHVKSELRLGKMHLVDLAGSERLALSGAEGETRLETQNINLSLTALGDVLSALSKNATAMAAQHRGQNNNKASLVPVPYRNSKLTQLLKDSLGGNSKTVMLTTIRVTDEYYQQTAISLMYAARAKKVRNRSLVN